MVAHLKAVCQSKPRRRRLYKTLIISAIGVFASLALLTALHLSDATNEPKKFVKQSFDDLKLNIEADSTSTVGAGSCRFHSCFDILRCGLAESGRIGVHIAPPSGRIVDAATGRLALGSPSRQFAQFLLAIESSPYYEPNPSDACLVVPAVDTLNERRVDAHRVERVLKAMPGWNRGENHLIFSMIRENSGKEIDFGFGLVAGGEFTRASYRNGFDVAVPVFNAAVVESVADPDGIVKKNWMNEKRVLVAVLAGSHDRATMVKELKAGDPGLVEVIQKCGGDDFKMCTESADRPISYPERLSEASYCLVFEMSYLLDAMMMGCIPVTLDEDSHVLPFSEVLDWKTASVTILKSDLFRLVSILERIPSNVTKSMSMQAYFFWKTYMSSIENIALTTLKIINDRVFTHVAWQYEDWNVSPDTDRHPDPYRITRPPPIFAPLKPAQSDGFTAVILTYNRVEMLFKVVVSVAQARSLSKIVVVWNNQDIAPPEMDMWPEVGKPLVVIRTSENKLGNRFYPHVAIETDAILNIDDDLFMLTGDELEFGYQVWREFPERLVGYPGRVHAWDEKSKMWKYEPEWTNEVSMVLSGAAFHHMFYSHAYTYMMPAAVRSWVDKHMNCEDIAINFLVSSYTRQPPIKVTPRKKFKCANCTAKESLWSDPSHFHERNVCFNHFVEVFGHMPLKAVEFRADPVLFRDNFPDSLKRFSAIRDV